MTNGRMSSFQLTSLSQSKLVSDLTTLTFNPNPQHLKHYFWLQLIPVFVSAACFYPAELNHHSTFSCWPFTRLLFTTDSCVSHCCVFVNIKFPLNQIWLSDQAAPCQKFGKTQVFPLCTATLFTSLPCERIASSPFFIFFISRFHMDRLYFESCELPT